MSSSPSIFVLGATGYIGGTVLSSLLESNPESIITVIYRQDAHKAILEKFSKNIVCFKASLSDLSILSDLASSHDVVVNCADADDVPAAHALIEGLEKGAESRIAAGKPKAVLLHTSGTGELSDAASPPGAFEETVYDDANLEQIVAMPGSRVHRNVTNLVAEAFERGHVVGYIVVPSCIYGPGTGPVNQLSIQIPNVIEYSLTQKRATYESPGENVWCHVHVHALGRLYASLLALTLSSNPPAVPKNGLEHYILAMSVHGPFSWKELTITVGDLLKELCELDEGGAVGKVGADVMGTTSVGISTRAKHLVGWEDTERLEDWLREDVVATSKRFRESNGVRRSWWGD